jgi:hypothetical protein
MIGPKMSRSGLRSRAITRTYIAIAVVGAMFCGALMVLPSEGAAQKIGPGYGRMQPIDLGKPERVTYSAPYSIPTRSQAKPVRAVAEPAGVKQLAALVIATSQPLYSRDTHRVY